jgi:pyrroloquinoline-quinone synthase
MVEFMGTAKTGFVGELFAVLREEAFRDPMFDAIRSGQMSRAGVKFWVLQARFVVHQFTRFISALHSACPDRAGQSLLAENLWEEHGRGNIERDHHTLIIKLAKSLGANDQELAHTEPLPETSAYIDHCLKVTREGSFVEGLTAIGVGIEHFMPVFFGVLADGLLTNYGLGKHDVEYLTVHIGEDEDHSRRALELIERFADSEEIKTRVKQALRDTLRAKRNFSEAVYRRALLAG